MSRIRNAAARLVLIGIVAALVSTACLRDAEAAFRWYGEDYYCQRLARYIHFYVNKERERRGIAALERSVTWNWVAWNHDKNMYRTGVFAHESSAFPSGWSTVWERFKQGHPVLTSYRYAENIAWRSSYSSNYQTAAKTYVNMWMNSSGHRANILDPKLKYMGVAFCRGYATQFFANQVGRRIN